MCDLRVNGTGVCNANANRMAALNGNIVYSSSFKLSIFSGCQMAPKLKSVSELARTIVMFDEAGDR